MKALICYNPKSGKQKVYKNLDYIKKRLSKKYEVIDVYETTGEKSLVSYLKEHSNNYDLVLVSGGDGTLNETVHGMIEGNSKTAIAYIPGGTCNDVGSMLRLSKNIKKALNTILEGNVEAMDIGKVQDRYFAYVFGAGKFIDISYETPHKLKKMFGKVSYFMYGMKELVTNKKMSVKFTLDDGTVLDDKYYVILGLNSNHVAGFHICRKENIKLNDGLFDLTLVKKKKDSIFKLAFFMLFGDKALMKKGVETYHVKGVKIESEEMISYNVDGEFAFQTNSCEIKLLKHAVNIIVPNRSRKKYF